MGKRDAALLLEGISGEQNCPLSALKQLLMTPMHAQAFLLFKQVNEINKKTKKSVW